MAAFLGWYRLDGHTPVPADEAGLADISERQVAREEATPGVTVSTVFVGLDHGGKKGAPLLFETMVFGGALDDETWRYSTWDEAEAGHRAVVERIRSRME